MKDREISREEAIKRLEEGAPFSELYDPHWEDALALAIKALKAELNWIPITSKTDGHGRAVRAVRKTWL